MKIYHKIQSLFKRDENKTIIPDQMTLPEFELLKNIEWIWTEKVDGTNIRVILEDKSDKFEFGGKTENAQIPTLLLKFLMNKFDSKMVDLLRENVPEGDITFYGEGYGAKIQKGGGNYLSDRNDFVLFDAIIGEWLLKRDSLENLASNHGIDVVPIVGKGTIDEAIEFVKSNPKSTWGDFNSEGLVIRPALELKQRNGKRIITKIKWADFVKLEASK